VIEKISQIKESDILNAAAVLRKGGLVAFPTETYYGLAVDPFNEDALARLFQVKRRSHLKPVLLLIDKLDQLKFIADHVPDVFNHLISEFWPGPLTLVFPAVSGLSSLLTGNSSTIGARQSSCSIATRLVSEFGGPITATSANKSGYKPALTAEEVSHIFNSDVDMILDGGKTPGGRGSTLIGYRSDKIYCIRKGCIKLKDIKESIRNEFFSQLKD